MTPIGQKHLFLIGLIVSLIIISANAKIPILTPKQGRKHPPKIIRTCCQFGSDVKMFGIPFRQVSAVTSIQNLGAHVYLGDKKEHNGIIYTHQGGFIDVGHLRDQADWTAFLYTKLLQHKGPEPLRVKLGREGGRKVLEFRPSQDLTDHDLLLMAGTIAFDLSMWHEISTWFGVSYIPFIPERYSSFSPEDIYSNALGVVLGIKAIQSDSTYEVAMTNLIQQTLQDLDAVHTEEETKEAMSDVEGLWWTRKVRLPSGRFLLRRYYDSYTTLYPWLIPKDKEHVFKKITLSVNTQKGNPLSEYYTLSFHTNFQIPVHKIFPEKKDAILTNKDFPEIVEWIKRDVIRYQR